ncbi:protein mono-ADP-ribosyltransferase PARP12-like [Harmonia axyridis]|uniref:protein mono-ADP-ribosyltransferase PARP12-like n=1 Tax=Harmonia axyridis TaxID=115357 RepID=UPI001E278DD3|nr:protein mono-ADP-ribosyltransferase PARP12-like [Harmonia axyridis]
MLYKDMFNNLPEYWTPRNYTRLYDPLVEVPVYSEEYRQIFDQYEIQVQPGPLYRIQNPHLFHKFMLKKNDYAIRGSYQIVDLFHDTVQANVNSIITYNIDWKYGERQRYGPGVYFSTSAYRAHKRSNKNFGPHKAMFLFDVLVGRIQLARKGEYLPDSGYDTVLSEDRQTYVKYFDHEYYPKYVLYYTESTDY